MLKEEPPGSYLVCFENLSRPPSAYIILFRTCVGCTCACVHDVSITFGTCQAYFTAPSTVLSLFFSLPLSFAFSLSLSRACGALSFLTSLSLTEKYLPQPADSSSLSSQHAPVYRDGGKYVGERAFCLAVPPPGKHCRDNVCPRLLLTGQIFCQSCLDSDFQHI